MDILGVINNIDLFTVGTSVSIIGVLGFIVYLNNKESVTNRTFLYIALSAIVWGIANYVSYQFSSAVLVLWISRLVIFSAVWYAFFLFQFFYIFPAERYAFSKWYKFGLLPVIVITSLINLTPLVFKGIAELAPIGQVSKLSIGPGIILFALVTLCLILGTIFLMVKKLWIAQAKERSQYQFIFLGAILTFSLHIVFNFILPAFLDNQRFIPLGAVFTFPFAALTSYAVVRHKLFNVRVIGAAALVSSLAIVTFIEVTLANSVVLIIYRSSVLFFILVFGILLIRGAIRDIRQREEIEKLAKELERAYEVEKHANEELEKLDKFKDQFLMTTQHNLRTPLTSMRGYTDLMLNGVFGKQTKKTTEVLGKLKILTDGMIKMVNDFLDMAKFQLGKDVVSLKPNVELLPILDEIIGELEFGAKQKEVDLKLEKPTAPIIISADREKLKAALFNIVDNSIKYSPKGHVMVKVEKGSVAKVTVSDNGIGIPKERLDTLFKSMFERGAEAQKVSTTGSGVGLYLSGQIINSHKGKVWAESAGEGKGSTFHIELPLS